MLILLPPSEGKSNPGRGAPLSLPDLAFPDLTAPRSTVLAALVDLCSTDDGDQVAQAAGILGVGTTQLDLVHHNSRLLDAPTGRADRIYAGVLYDALDVGSLGGPARRRAASWLAITSALFGVVRPHDRIPAYRLSGGTTIPGVGPIARFWRSHLDPVLTAATGNGLLIDLRSSTYATFWRPGSDLADRTATVRVLHEVNGTRSVVSHFNKATKGRIVRDLLADGSAPRTPGELADHLTGLGWKVEAGEPGRAGQQLEVIVREV